MERNLTLPGHLRYQPQDLKPIFGYDNLYRCAIEVEFAALETLGEAGFIPSKDMQLLTPEVKERAYQITTTEVDALEREILHDIRALVRLIQARLPEPLQRWVHVPLTSYDVISTATALMFKRAHEQVVKPKVNEVMRLLARRVEEHAKDPQIGRTHGQWAVPVTIGFWLASVLNRILSNAFEMCCDAELLEGKISGPVGAYNAQYHLGISAKFFHPHTFEEAVLSKLGLDSAKISTQIVPPDSLAHYLHSCVLLSAALGQFGQDCRNLARSEILELVEKKEEGQVGSSSMPQKTNPIWAEQLVGMYEKNTAEYLKVLRTMISDHQRDLVGSSVMRDFPVIVVNLVTQLDGLLRKDKKTNRTRIERLTFDTERCVATIKQAGSGILAEPAYLMLQIAGYEGDAHKLLNDTVIPRLARQGAGSTRLEQVLWVVANEDHQRGNAALADALHRVPREQLELLNTPERYIGLSAEKALEIAAEVNEYVAS